MAKKAKSYESATPGLWLYNLKFWLEARRLLQEALDPLGLRAKDFWLLSLAGEGNMSQQRIAELCGLDPSSLVAILDDFERRGWVRRQRNPDDRRIQWVQRTEIGDDLFHQALPRAQRAEKQHLAALSDTHRRQLLAAMRKLVATTK